MSFPAYEEYKDSGVEWLGEVPEHWEVDRLRNVGPLLKGCGGSKQDVVDAGVPCVRYGDLYTTHAYSIQQARTFVTTERAADYFPIQRGDVLFAASGEDMAEIGRSAVVLFREQAVCGGDLVVLRPTVDVVPEFIGYASDCSAVKAQKASLGRGTTVKHIYPDELKRVMVALPPPAEQTAIASFLDIETSKIDSLVSEQRRLIELLKEKRQAVISHAVTKGLNPDVKMKPSGIQWLGDVPEHWEILPVQRLAKKGNKTFTDGDWIERPYVTDSGVRLLQTGNVGIGNFREKGFRYVSNETFDDLKCTEVLPGDVLICRLDGPVGRACLAPDLGVRMITSVDNAILKVADDVVSEFVVHIFTSMQWLSWVEAICRVGGGFRLRISRSMLGNSRVPVPPHEEQLKITKHIATETDRFNSLQAQAERAIELLQERRTALISAAVTGKIDVRGYARTKQEAVA